MLLTALLRLALDFSALFHKRSVCQSKTEAPTVMEVMTVNGKCCVLYVIAQHSFIILTEAWGEGGHTWLFQEPHMNQPYSQHIHSCLLEMNE